MIKTKVFKGPAGYGCVSATFRFYRLITHFTVRFTEEVCVIEPDTALIAML
jgi:hypothetical protein